MPGVETATLLASCGDPQTGSTTTFVNGLGVSRVSIDNAVGTIEGPGSQTVFVEGYNVSLPEDLVAGHGDPPHAAPTTNDTGSPNVFAS